MSALDRVPPKSIRLTTSGVEIVHGSAPAPEPPLTDPRVLLAENHRIEALHARPVDLSKPPSRRARDYWVVLILGNALIAGLVAILPKNPFVLLFGLSGLVMFSAGITWVVWVVMSDY